MTDVLWDAESHVEAVLRSDGPLTQPQIAHAVWGVSVHPTGNREDDRKRTSAIRATQNCIQALRRRNVAVVDTSRGMRISAASEEIAAEIDGFNSRVKELLITRAGLRRAYRIARAIEEGRLPTPADEPLTLWVAA